MPRKTVGTAALESLQKDHETRDPIELQREIHKQYEDEIIAALERGKKQFVKDFYIIVLNKKERLLPNVIRSYYFPRASCPTPEYDQTVYRYQRHEDMLTFLWVIPSKDTCHLLRENALIVEEKELLQCVLEFYDGTLDRRAASLNKERV